VITEGADDGRQVSRFPVTGNETVLDAIGMAKVPLIGLGQKHVCVQRKSDPSSQVLPVDLEAITQGGNPATNYVLWPGDRVFIKSASSDPVRELEAILEVLREARSQGEQGRVVEDLDVLTKKLREQLKKPEGASRP
jgi:protein involved in polysaccharide export with SLBB domain